MDLINAARDGNLHRVKDLLKNDIDPNFQDASGDSALHWAARGGHIDVIKYLVQSPDTELCVENKNNETAFDLAWNTDNALDRTCVLDTIGKAYIDKAKSIASSSDERPHQTLHSQVDETFYEATLAGNYERQLSEDDLRGLLQFFCRPLSNVESFGQIMIAVTFMLDTAEEKPVRLLKFEEKKEIFFVPYWDRNPLDLREVKFDIPVKAQNTDEVVAQTEALLKLQVVCDWLSTFDLPKQRKKMADINLDFIQQEINKQFKRVEIRDDKSFRDGRGLLANILNEVNSTVKKIEFVSEFLRTLLQEEGLNQFSHKSANGLIFFLETFALEGISPGITMKHEETTRLSQKKKNYYLRFYPQKESRTYLKTIQDLRNSILHIGSNTYVSLESLDCFVKNDLQMNVKDFLGHLLDFSEHIMTNMRHNSDKELEKPDLETFFDLMKTFSNSFLKTENAPKEESISNPSSKLTPEPELRRFCENVKNMLDGIDLFHELLFDLVVNIQPKIQIERSIRKPQVYLLRNSVVHDFPNLTLQKLKEDIPLAVHDLYRYELAGCINKILITFRAFGEPADLEQQFTDALKTVDANYENFQYYLSTESLKGSFMYHSNDISWMQTDKYVEIYTKYMVPLFDVETGEEKGESIINTHADINVMQKREVYELFWRLDNTFTPRNKEEFITRQQTLKQYLIKNLHVDETVSQSVTELAERLNHAPNESFSKKIKGFLDSLEALRTESTFKRKRLSRQDMIVLYSAFIKNKKPFSFQNHEDLLRSVELTNNEKAKIEERLAPFPDCKQVEDIFYGSKKVQVNVSSVILNLLKMSNEILRFYQLKIEGIATVFSDATVLRYLVSRAIKCENPMEFKSNHITSTVIKDIRGINFTTPYVASLLSTTRFLGVIESDLLLEVVVSLIQCYPTDVYLEDLLSINHKRVMELLPKVLFEEELTDENMRTVLEALTKAKVVGSSTTHLQSKFAHPCSEEEKKIIRRYLWAANDVLLGLIDDDNLEHADNILDHVKGLKKPLNNQNQDDRGILTEQNLLEAKILNRRALHKMHKRKSEKTEQDEAGRCGAEYCDRALLVLNQIPKPQDTSDYPRYMRALSQKYASYDIKKKCLDDVSQVNLSMQLCEELLDVLWHYVTSENGSAPSLEEFYSRVNRDQKYNDLIGSHRECSKFLDILKIFDCLILDKFTVAKQLSSPPQSLIDVLTMWYALYSIRKKQDDNIHAERAVIRILRRIRYAHSTLCQKYGTSFDILRRYHKIKAVQSAILNYKASSSQGPYTQKVSEAREALKSVLQLCEKCAHCKRSNHTSDKCFFKDRKQCGICKKWNHEEEKCYYKNKKRERETDEVNNEDQIRKRSKTEDGKVCFMAYNKRNEAKGSSSED